jgi:hypothetical protein
MIGQHGEILHGQGITEFDSRMPDVFLLVLYFRGLKRECPQGHPMDVILFSRQKDREYEVRWECKTCHSLWQYPHIIPRQNLQSGEPVYVGG